MISIIDLDECQKDSPKFRQWLNNTEKNFFNVENKVEKVIKQSHQVVSSGRVYISEQEQMITTLSDISSCFTQDPLVTSSIAKLLECLRETISYQQALIDQTNRAVAEHLASYIKSEVKRIKEIRQNFEKCGSELDYIIHKAAGYSKLQDTEDAQSQLVRVRKAFRHCAIDYAKALAIGRERNRYEVLFSTLSHTKAYSTFYHQGSDLCNDFGPTFNQISKDICEIKLALEDMEKKASNLHFDVSGEDIPPSPTEASNDIAMQGYLFKRSTNAFKTWNYRFFILQYNKLLYQKRSGEEVTIMEEDLRLCNVKMAVDAERKFCFEITSNAKNHLLQAESENSRRRWIDILNKAITAALSDDTLAKYDYEPLSQAGSPDGAIRSKHSPIVTPSSKPSVLYRIMRVSGNDACCDCYNPNPKWASINLGITLCIECSGIHRSLGVHRSKVRSLTLDHWDDEVVSVMEALGNAIVNEIYLGNSPTDAMERATPNCERSIREKWIKLKYLDRKFVLSLNNTDSLTNILQSIQDHRLLDTSIDNISLDSSSKSSIDGEELFIKKKIEEEDSDLWDPLKIGKMTPNEILLKASETANLPLMLVALSLGADKSCQREDGKLPLHFAVLSNSLAALEFLLQNGSSVNVIDKESKSPLHLASIKNNIFHVYRLLIAKADHKLKDNTAQMPLDYAIETNEPHLVTLLRVATLFDQLERDSVEEEMKAIMMEISGKRFT